MKQKTVKSVGFATRASDINYVWTIAAAVLLTTLGVCATTLTWDANSGTAGIQNGAGAWLGTGLWWNGSANVDWTSGDDAIFGGPATAGGAVTLASPTSVNSLTFNTAFTGTYTLGTAGQTLTITNGIIKNAGSAAVTFVSPITLGAAQVWTNGSTGVLKSSGGLDLNGNVLTINGAGNTDFSGTSNFITGAGGITKNGSGLLYFGAGGTTPVHNYTGPTIINGGVVMTFGDNNTAVGNFTLNNAMLTDYYQSTTSFTSGLGTGDNQIQIYGDSGFGGGNGNSTWRIGGTGSVLKWGTVGEGATGFFNPTTLKLRSTADNNGPSTFGQVTLDNRLDLNSGARTFDVLVGSGNVGGSWGKIDDGIQDTGLTGSLTKTGGGSLILGGTTSTWGGNTTISGGLLMFDGTLESNIGGGSARNISVAAGAGIRFNALDNAILNRIVETNAEFTVMSSTTANNLDFSSSTGANLPQAFLGNWAGNGAKMEYSGTITPASDNYRLGGKDSSGLLGIVGANKLTGLQGLLVGGTGASGVRVELASSMNFTGDTVINTGAKLTLGNNLALQNSSLNLGSAGGTFALSTGALTGRITGSSASPSPTFGGLKGSRNLYTAFASTGGNNEALLVATNVTGFTLNLATGKTNTYSGTIGGFGAGASGVTGGAMTLTKSGAGTQIFSGAHTYTGATIVAAGTLALGAHNVLKSTAPLVIGNGNLDMGTYTNVIGTLNVTGSTGTINLGSGAKLVFADSTSVTWSGTKVKITGNFVPGESIRFGTSSTALDASQLSKISSSGGGYAALDENGFLKFYTGTLIQVL